MNSQMEAVCPRFASFALIVLGCMVLVGNVTGCRGLFGSKDEEPASASTADRFADLVDDDRETVLIGSPELAAQSYEVSPAAFDTVFVRAMPGRGQEPRVVEALLKGSFPDGCTELNDLAQTDTRGGESANLTMRRPREAVCTQAVRPYRFFFELKRRYAPGEYTLVVNERPFRFVVE